MEIIYVLADCCYEGLTIENVWGSKKSALKEMLNLKRLMVERGIEFARLEGKKFYKDVYRHVPNYKIIAYNVR